MTCKLCEIRRPRRFCPGVRGDICAICCGENREITVDCPLDCEYLQGAREHEKPASAPAEEIPNQDVRVTEEFVQEREELFVFAGRTLLEAGLGMPGVVDYDLRDALAALTRTYRTMESGLIYESQAPNIVAAQIQQHFRQQLDRFQQQRREAVGMETIRGADVLGILVFLQRLEISYNNGRKRGRAFLDFLHKYFPPPQAGPETGVRMAGGGPSVIVP